jgi:hypothetical protein
VLLPKQRVLALEGGQLLDLASLAGLELDATRSAQPTVPDFLAPAREHEGMDVERLGDVLDLNAGKIAETHGLTFELDAVAVGLPWALDPSHRHLLER